MQKKDNTVIYVHGRPVKALKKAEGLSSVVYKTNNGLILKKLNFVSPSMLNLLDRELYWLKKLDKSGVTPRVADLDRQSGILVLEDCGDRIGKHNLPEDWRTQLEHILDILKKNNCRHNDLSEKEILVKNDQLYVVDFAAASFNEDMTCEGRFPDYKKNRLFADEFIVNLIDFLFLSTDKSSEPHCFVLWDISEYKTIKKEIAEHFKIVQSITYSTNSVNLLSWHRLEFLKRFYHGRVSNHGEKATQPFVLFFVLDLCPRYGFRKNYFNGDERVLNTNMFDLLKKLRKGRSGFLHGSDNIQESYDNLEALTFYTSQIPISYWKAWRPRFDSIQDFFEKLNSTDGLKYVVLRNYESLIEKDEPDPGNDIDLLVNDYYLFKQVTGAIGYKHKTSSRYKNKGEAVEYGGYKVAGKVLIGSKEIPVDIRFIGDNYYEEKWEKDILQSRVFNNVFYVPDSTHWFYSLLYHALVHKRNFSDKYREIISRYADTNNLIRNSAVINNNDAWSLLDAFMEKKEYKYVRPNELSIPFNAREKAGITIKNDLLLAKSKFRTNNYLESRHLLYRILQDDTYNIQARMILLRIESNLFLHSVGLHAPLLKLCIKDITNKLAKKLKI